MIRSTASIFLTNVIILCSCSDVEPIRQNDVETMTQELGSVQFRKVASANWHSLALSTTGDVYGWGMPIQAGQGSAYRSYVMIPKKIDKLTDIADIVTAHEHSFAIKTDGSLYCWGRCTASTIDSVTWQILGLTDVLSAATGTSHSIVVSSNGKVFTWGSDNSYGQLGDGTFSPRTVPQEIVGFSGPVIAVAAQGFGSLALTSDGSVYWWGSFDYGGTASRNPSPVRLSGLSGIKSISAGDKHVLALDSLGQVWTWGFNLNGELGLGHSMVTKTINRVTGLPLIRAISAGWHTGYALAVDGTVYAWGFNWCGLGDGTATNSQLSPVKINGINNLRQISAGNMHAMSVNSSQQVEAWGCNNYGQLGDGTLTDQYAPSLARTP